MDRSEFLLEKTKKYIEELREIDLSLASPEVLSDIIETRSLTKRRRLVADIVELRSKLFNLSESKKAHYEEIISSKDLSERMLLTELLNELKLEESNIALELLSLIMPNGNNEIEEIKVEFNSSGVDNGFIDKLIKMYSYYATIHELNFQKDNNSLIIKGKNAYLYFESANCLHKLYDVKTVSVEVKVCRLITPEKIEIDPRDVRIDIFLSHGKGGQNINKVETAVRLTHYPSGIVISCQDERSQLKNKDRAFERLAEALQERENNRVQKLIETNQIQINNNVNRYQRKFSVKDNKFSDSRCDVFVDLDFAYKGEINEVVEAILINNLQN